MADDEQKKPEGASGDEQPEQKKKSVEEMRTDITNSIPDFGQISQWLRDAVGHLRDKLPENALPELQNLLTETGKKLDGIDKDATLIAKVTQGAKIFYDTSKDVTKLAEKHLKKEKEQGEGQEAGEEKTRGGTALNSTLLAASMAAVVGGQKMAKGSEEKEAGTMRKIFGRVLQVVGAAVAVVASVGLAQGKSATDLVSSWRNRVSSEDKGQSQGRTA